MKTIADDSANKLTKREYFAAMAMMGIWANPSGTNELNNGDVARIIAELAVEQADALIKQLNK